MRFTGFFIREPRSEYLVAKTEENGRRAAPPGGMDADDGVCVQQELPVLFGARSRRCSRETLPGIRAEDGVIIVGVEVDSFCLFVSRRQVVENGIPDGCVKAVLPGMGMDYQVMHRLPPVGTSICVFPAVYSGDSEIQIPVFEGLTYSTK